MNTDLKLEKPGQDTKQGLIIVPGISSGPYGRLFDEVADFAKTQNHYVIRINTWDGPKDLEEKTLKQLHQLINEAARKFRENGCEEIKILGKSFGGQLTLTHPDNQRFAKMILWAPALSIDKEGNLAKWRQTQLKEAEKPKDIKISTEKLRETTTPTKIIHGKQDQVIPIENSRKLQKHLPKSRIEVIENTGRSYKGKEKTLIETTQNEILN